MSSRPIAPDSGLQQLVDENFRVELRQQHLLVHDVPYVAPDGVVKRGILACKYVKNGDLVLPPNAHAGGDTHQVWWQGEMPCYADRRPLEGLADQPNVVDLFPGFSIQHQFSNKPEGQDHYPDHHAKVTHYVRLIQAQAAVLAPYAQAQRGGLTVSTDEAAPHRYPDAASVRADILATAARLAGGPVAIVGLGGTGSYVLDQVAKTAVPKIHLFDGDVFQQHNAFRSPGAATEQEIAARMSKVDLYHRRYDHMHRGIVPHAYPIEPRNVAELTQFSFVFLCVDEAGARKCIAEFLVANGIPFVDVGMNLQRVAGSQKLVGSCRATLVTQQRQDHLDACLPMVDGEGDGMYRQNIQVADMNALNAQLAVMLWKQHCQYYASDFGTRHLVFSVNQMLLNRMTPTEAAEAKLAQVQQAREAPHAHSEA